MKKQFENGLDEATKDNQPIYQIKLFGFGDGMHQKYTKIGNNEFLVIWKEKDFVAIS